MTEKFEKCWLVIMSESERSSLARAAGLSAAQCPEIPGATGESIPQASATRTSIPQARNPESLPSALRSIAVIAGHIKIIGALDFCSRRRTLKTGAMSHIDRLLNF